MISKQQKRPPGRPLGEANMEQIAIRLPKPMLTAIDDAIAGRLDGKTRSDFIRELIAEALEVRMKRAR
jgi:metal-responsive CopG/Arc/MetJ family transcriptional regulator